MADTRSKSTLSIVAVVAALLALAVSLGSMVIGQRSPAGLAGAGPNTAIQAADGSDLKRNGAASATSAATTATTTQSLQALTAELRQEQASRLQLQRQVDTLEEDLANATEQMEGLQERLEEAEQGIAQAESETTGNDVHSDGVASSEELREAHRSAFGNNGGNNGRFGGFGRTRSREERISSLQSAGVDEVRASELVQRLDQNQLAELELRDEAARGGWQDSDEFTQRLEQLEAEAPDLREELGDEAYDRYLFANGSTNRVVIGSVINGSAANVAGLQVGDTVLSYAGQRLFNIPELQSATRAGVRGESVQVTLQRDGETLNMSVTRGPLGVTLTRDQQDPN